MFSTPPHTAAIFDIMCHTKSTQGPRVSLLDTSPLLPTRLHFSPPVAPPSVGLSRLRRERPRTLKQSLKSSWVFGLTRCRPPDSPPRRFQSIYALSSGTNLWQTWPSYLLDLHRLIWSTLRWTRSAPRRPQELTASRGQFTNDSLSILSRLCFRFIRFCWSCHPCRRPGLLLCSILFLKQRVCPALRI